MKVRDLLSKKKTEAIGTIGAGTAAPSPTQQAQQAQQSGAPEQVAVDPRVAAQQQLLIKKQMQDQVKSKQDELIALKQQLAKMI